jgi:hypothetical protein
VTVTQNTGSPCSNPTASGVAGSLTWSLCPDGTLTISGNGAMPDYTTTGSPWYSYKEKITKAVIQNGTARIGNNAFSFCCNMTSIIIPGSVTYIGSYAFFSCEGLKSVTIPSGVTSIETSSFCGCNSLTSIIIPHNVTSIGGAAFSLCISLKSVTIPGSVTSIAVLAFQGCTGLKDVTVEWATPVSITSHAFSDVPLNSVTLHVPASAKVRYEAANIWKEFGKIEVYTPSDTDSPEFSVGATCYHGILSVTTPKAEQVEVYSVSGQLLFTARKDGGKATFDLRRLPRGVLIVRGSSGWGEKIINN